MAHKFEKKAAKNILAAAHKLIAEQTRDMEEDVENARLEANQNHETGTVYVRDCETVEDMLESIRQANVIGLSLSNGNDRISDGAGVVLNNGGRYFIPYYINQKSNSNVVEQVRSAADTVEKQIGFFNRKNHYIRYDAKQSTCSNFL